MSGWKALLAGPHDNITIAKGALVRCPHCQENNIRLPDGVQGTLVGRACIKEGHALRKFEIQPPRALQSAQEMGKAAVSAWHQENDTPPLDSPPAPTALQKQALIGLCDSIPDIDTPSQTNLWENIAVAGDALIASTQSLSRAAHLFIAYWRLKGNPTTLQKAGMEIFRGMVDDVFQTGMELATLGAKAHSHALPARFPQGPYHSVRDDPHTALEHLRPDVIEGRLFIFSKASEQFTEDLMVTRLSLVEQKDKIRYICDPRLEINERTDSRRHPLLIVPTIPALLRRVLFWKRRYPGIPVLPAKRDVRSAFKLIPLSISMLLHAGFKVEHYILAYLSLYFGWKGSPGTWGVMATLTLQFISRHRPVDPHENGPGHFEAFQIVDDGGFAEPALSIRPWICSSLWGKG